MQDTTRYTLPENARTTRLLWLPVAALTLALLLLLPTWRPALGQSEPPAAWQDLPDTPFVATIHFADPAQLQRWAGTLDIWSVDHNADVFTALVTPALAQAIRADGLTVTVDQARTARLHPPAEAGAAAAPGAAQSLACYRTVAETYADLAALADTYPHLVTWTSIGDSWERVNADPQAETPEGEEIRTLVLTNRDTTPADGKFRLYIIAAIHAREMSTAELATRFAEYLVQAYGFDPDVTWLLDAGEVHITPIANPDGRKRAQPVYNANLDLWQDGAYWRKNTNNTECSDFELPGFQYYGVDLNRNSNFRWNSCPGCSSANACAETFRGRSPGSEPETQAVQAYAASIFADQRGPNDDDAAPADATGLFISLHSYSNLVLYPWGWTTTPSPNAQALAALGHKFNYFNSYSVCQAGAPGCLYRTDGTTDDWTYGELGVASYTFELGNEFFEQCSFFEEEILPDNVPALLYAMKAARRPYQSPSGPDVTGIVVSRALSETVPATDVQIQATVSDTRYGFGYINPEAEPAIQAVRFTLDAPSWETEPLSVTVTALDGAMDEPTEIISATISTAEWPPGRRLLLVEAQDVAGNWGPPTAVFVESAIERRWLPLAVFQPPARPEDLVTENERHGGEDADDETLISPMRPD